MINAPERTRREIGQALAALLICLAAAPPAEGRQDEPAGSSVIEQERAALRALTPPLGGDRRLSVDSLTETPMLAGAAAATALVATTVTTGDGDRRRTLSDQGSGVLISPCMVLTVRHLLGEAASPRSGAVLEAEVRFHTRDAGPIPHRVAEVAAAGGAGRVLLDDWALLRLETPVEGIEPLRLSDDPCCGRTAPRDVALAGYPGDRYDPLQPAAWVDPACGRPIRLANSILSTRCQATSGNSGGPLLLLEDDGWRVIGILTRAPGPREGRGPAYALPLHPALRDAIVAAEPGRCGPSAGPQGPT